MKCSNTRNLKVSSSQSYAQMKEISAFPLTYIWSHSLIFVITSQLFFPMTNQEIVSQTFWSMQSFSRSAAYPDPATNKRWGAETLHRATLCCSQRAADRGATPSTECTRDCGAGPFLALQITFMNWSLISMQQAWENDKLLLTLSWQLKKWLLWKNKVHNRRKAKASFLSSVWHLLFNIQNCIIVTHTSAGIVKGWSVIVIIISSYFQGLHGSSPKSRSGLQAVIQDFSPEAKFIVQILTGLCLSRERKKSCHYLILLCHKTSENILYISFIPS